MTLTSYSFGDLKIGQYNLGLTSNDPGRVLTTFERLHSQAMAATSLLLALIAIVFFTCIVTFSSRPSLPKGSRYPPGPPGKPLVGNLLDVSTSPVRFRLDS